MVTLAGNDTTLFAWLRLMQTPGIGDVTARKLLAAFGLPEQIFEVSYSTLLKIVPEPIARALTTSLTSAEEQAIESALAWHQLPGNQIVTLADQDYPQRLLEIADPPCVLYVKGQIHLLQQPAIAIVGSRHATSEGIQNAMRFATTLSQAGLTVVSGLAQGIDGAAHEGALQGQGSTIAVMGTGANLVYPAAHHALAHRIAEKGCLVTEYPLGTNAQAGHFPKRNRLISGLSQGVLVVEAAVASGTLITARMALEQSRDVFAIPGSIHSPLSKGCHQLIKQGAKLVESARDILEELRLPIASTDE